MKKSFDFYFLLVFTGAFLFGVSWLIYWGARAIKIEKLLGVIFMVTGSGIVLLLKRHYQLKLLILALQILAPYFGFVLVLYFLLGGLSRERSTQKVGLYVDKQPKINPKKCQIDYFKSGGEFFERYLLDIKNASKTVKIYYYIFSGGECQSRLLSTLFEKLTLGVKITLVADWYGSGNFYKSQTIRELKKRGATVLCYNRPRFMFLPKDNIRCHAKVTLIDDNILYLPSCNLNDKEILTDKNVAVRISGEIQQAINEYDYLFIKHKYRGRWRESAPVIGCKNNLSTIKDCLKNESLFTKLNLPDGKLRIQALSLIAMAKESVIIVTPYLSLDKIMTWEITKALLNGVKVSFIISNKPSKRWCLKLSKMHADYLYSLGVRVYGKTDSFLHAKAIIVDGKICQVGSANFDVRSLREATESTLICADNRLIAPLLSDFSQYITPQNELFSENKKAFNTFKRGMIRLLSPLI